MPSGVLMPTDCMERTISSLRDEDVPAISLDIRNMTSIHTATKIYFITSRRFAILKLLLLDLFEDLLVGRERS